VITGGSKGPGLAMAEEFASSGADVARNPDTLAEARQKILVGAKGKVAAWPESAPISVSRAAQMALSKVLSGEGAPYNALVNSLHVGVIVSDQIVRRHRSEGTNVSSISSSPKPGGRCRWAAWVGPRNSPTSPGSWSPTPPLT